MAWSILRLEMRNLHNAFIEHIFMFIDVKAIFVSKVTNFAMHLSKFRYMYGKYNEK